jgi:hypothetical protein
VDQAECHLPQYKVRSAAPANIELIATNDAVNGGIDWSMHAMRVIIIGQY